MARVTHVKKAQQRYETVPVIDPETGEQKVTPVLRRDGTPKTTKHGRPVVRRITVEDKSKPLPNRKCDKCGKEIEVGSSYKWIAPKSGPYGGSKRYRCSDCPTWQVWEYSYSLSARIAQIQNDFQFDASGYESAEDVTSWLSEFAEAVRELATEKEEGADNIESGFGHETSQSEELREIAEQLNNWADEIEQADIPEYPEIGEVDCDECDGSGDIDCDGCDGSGEVEVEDGEDGETDTCNNCDGNGTVNCETCGGSGQVEGEEPSDDELNDWISEVEDAVSSVADNCPI